MPQHSSTSTKSTRLLSHQKGFTLLEIMVVTALIVIILSFAALSVGGGASADVEEEARRLQRLLGLLHEESVLQGHEAGIGFTRQGYRFFYLEEQKWLDMDGKDLFRKRSLPASMISTLTVEGAAVELLENTEKPQIVLFSDGELTPFLYTLSIDNTHYKLEGSLAGALLLKREQGADSI